MLLKVDHLTTVFRTEDTVLRAVDDVSFTVARGETLGIVGESGSGKSITALSIMGLAPKPAAQIIGGRIEFDGKNLLECSDAEIRRVRGKHIAMIFQDPMTSLNPVLTIGRQITESLRLHLKLGEAGARSRAAELLDLVGIPSASKRLNDYPHQFSGGMRQRVMIAMALSCDPELLIADEPTTALDVTIQAQILELINKLKSELGTAVIMITHDLGVVAGMADRVMIMYAGRVVEEGHTREIFTNPRMPYTIGLLQSVPRLDDAVGRTLTPIRGLPPDQRTALVGCPFAPRCDYFVAGRCDVEVPVLRSVGNTSSAACLFDITKRTLVTQEEAGKNCGEAISEISAESDLLGAKT